jgi:hypothetical protein
MTLSRDLPLVYFGAGAAGLTGNAVASVGSRVEAGHTGTFVCDPSGQKVYLAFRQGWPAVRITLDGLEGGWLDPRVETIHGLHYTVYETVNYLTGTAIPFLVTEVTP